jgi:hypothetical protein
MTAVEWLKDNFGYIQSGNMSLKFYFEQAKEMEKEQIIECGNCCAIKQHIHNERVNKMTMDEMLEFSQKETLTFGEQYYNETYKTK